MLGDLVCRRFFSFLSIPHRIAAAFFAGFVFSSCFTYLFALVFAWTSQPLLYANILFFAVAVGLIFLLRRSKPYDQPGDGSFALLFSRISRTKQTPLVKLDSETRSQGSWKWDLACLSACFVFSCWLMFATLGFSDGNFQFSVNSWSDFGPHLSLSQSFAWGNNFPTEHPFYPGEAIRYHFLFWFQAANLSFLGLNLAWAINLLSVLSLMSLLVSIMAFAELLFGSRAVGRIAAILFFFSATSLSYIPFLLSQSSLGETISSIVNARHYLKSGFPYYGDDWGALTVGIFSYQRHLIIGSGILFLVLVFLVDFYRRRGAIVIPGIEPQTVSNAEVEKSGVSYDPDDAHADETEITETIETPEIVPSADNRRDIKTLIFCGLLIGALPYLNSAVFVAATIIVFGLLLFFPQRRYLLILIAATIVIALPQVLMLRSGNSAPDGGAMFHWGYIIADPTFPQILKYLAWTFGFKWLLLLVALWFLPSGQRRLFLSVSLLVIVVFTVQLSTYIFNNHKLLNIWNIFAAIYIAYAIWHIGKASITRAVLAAVLTIATIFGSVIDLFPLHNDSWINVPYKNDRLTNWVFENTNPNDVFLADRLISHPIVFAGRKVFLGHTTFVWTAGYEFGDREKTYRAMFLERNRARLVRQLRKNNIAYVAIDDGLRKSSGMDEAIFQQRFEKVFEDTENHYGNLTIYRVPLARF